MQAQVQLGDLAVEVIRKDIKNINLSVHPPTGGVTFAAPSRLSRNYPIGTGQKTTETR